MYYNVALLSPPFATLTYVAPEWWPQSEKCFFTKGLRVVVPLGKSMRAAVIVSSDNTEPPKNIKIKSIAWPLERKVILDAGYMEMIEQLALRQYRTVGDILGHILPVGLRLNHVKLRYFVAGKAKILNLKSICTLPHKEQQELACMLLSGEAEMLLPRQDAASTEICVLEIDPPWPVRPLAKRQIAILDYLHEKGSTSRRTLSQALSGSSSTSITSALTSLIKNKYVSLCQGHIEEDGLELLPPPALDFELSKAQAQALKALELGLNSENAQSHLLFGVTGSGKTAVYLELAKLCFAQNKSILLLAPEVALALKLKRDADLALPHMPVFLYHGYQNPAKREHLFRTLASFKEPCIVVGTRSALFLPISNLGTIVLDEEHDASYKQDEKLHYHAKEVAWFRISQQKGLLVLGSATPDIKTYYATKEKQLPVQLLANRVGGGTLPEINLVDIGNQSGSGNILAKASEQALIETLQRGEQAVILLNRRGYAPLMYCLQCGKVAKCPHCEIGLTYHKSREKLMCHYCGYNVDFPSICPHCKGLHYLPMGDGTEKVAEYVNNFTSKPVLRLDRDSTRREGRVEEILRSFAHGESQILVGTQMLSKGHHFPNVTLALVADADVGLNLPDYRAAERTFQLLLQSAGRAGRGNKPGAVLIQTRDIKHYCWQYIHNADYEGFYTDELARRAKRLYPPFVFLALIRISYARELEQGASMIEELGANLRKLGQEHDVIVLGPAPAPLALLRGKRRVHCLLKSKGWNSLRQVYALLLKKIDQQNIRVSLDLDPISML